MPGKVIALTLACLFSLGCQRTAKLEGLWEMEVTIQERTAPFHLNFKDNNTVEFVNGAETFSLEYQTDSDGKITIPILNYEAALVLRQKDKKLKGSWVRHNTTPPYNEPVTGVKIKSIPKLPAIELPQKWKMELSNEEGSQDAILVFTHSEVGTYASVITATGDYRYLTPRREGNRLILTGFDGVFAFHFSGELSEEAYSGSMRWGRSWKQSFKAAPDADFELPDPTQATQYAGDLSKLILPRLDGGIGPVAEKDGARAKVIQIFGSWCPNCIDETRFINQWRQRNPEKPVSFAMISFERASNKQAALKSLAKARDLYQIDYPIFIGGYTSEDKVSQVLPELENFIAFPTTIFLDRENRARKIHAGFAGPATGSRYEKFAMDFDKMIEKLIEE